MLTQLQLTNFAVVSANDLAVFDGFTVVTGETGAGKSLIVDALLCLTGARADSGMVRFGSERAELSAVFGLADAPEALAWLKENDCDEDGECQLRRVIRADGGSKAWINGRNATLSQLAELGALLLEIHGQHDQQHLLERRKQLGLLDEFGQAGKQASQVQTLARQWNVLQQQIDRLQSQGDVSARIAELEHQLQELNRQPIDPANITEAVARHKRHSQSHQLLAATASALAQLDGDETANGLALLQSGAAQLSRWQAEEPVLAGVVELLESASIQVKEAVSELQQWQDGIELDAGELATLEAQLSHWHELARRHRIPMESLQEKADALQQELDGLRGAGDTLNALLAERKTAAAEWQNAAAHLTTTRRQASDRLGVSVSSLMAELGMAGGQFVVELEANADEQPQLHGAERCEFLVSANPGQPPRPLRKVASGGELARISLAIEVATLGLDPTPTMVFDEVDAGIGGAVAEVVGQKLRALGKGCQVLCVTHLAQVASLGHQHLRVAKQSDGASTESQVQTLDGDARVQEIARMMGGKTLTAQTLAHAAAMLDHGQSV
ncbi:DNA repair protein RecN [Arenimonas sp.]|jgi:DNA repair protein RecN (Recombination protein N)|uniref:DNA repair protein RecN n=1 Tax=Arenimonas sp. TaxID=1872635 RepID=UPI0037C1B0CC